MKFDLKLGNCLELMKELDDRSIDLILTDLPYNVTKNKWDQLIPFIPLWEEYERIIKDNGAIILHGQQPFTSMLIMSNDSLFRYDLVWEKSNPTGYLNAKKMPMRAHESILVFYKNPPTYNPQKTYGHQRKVSTAHHKRNSIKTTNYGEHSLHTYDSTERYPRSVLKFASDKQKQALHPTQKPVGLLEYLIKTYTNPGDTVLDSCFGSCSTGVACINTERNFIGMEKDESFFNIGQERMNNNIKNLIEI